jgi:hypothetical protein
MVNWMGEVEKTASMKSLIYNSIFIFTLLVGIVSTFIFGLVKICTKQTISHVVETEYISEVANQSSIPNEIPKNREQQNLLVIAGESIGPIYLNDKLEDIFKIFPFVKNYDALRKESVYKIPEGTIECAGEFLKVVFNKNNLVEGILSFYYKNEKVVQIEVESSKFYMKNGIMEGDSLSSLLKKCKECQTYILRGSGGEKVGGKDFIYLVNEPEGVAFEIRYDKKQKRRTLDRFIIFNKNSLFKPGTCITPPQSFEAVPRDSIDRF